MSGETVRVRLTCGCVIPLALPERVDPEDLLGWWCYCPHRPHVRVDKVGQLGYYQDDDADQRLKVVQ